MDLGAGQMLFFGIHETPQLVELAFAHMQIVPERQHNHAAVTSSAREPGADGVLTHLDDPPGRTQRITFRQGADRKLENRPLGLQAIIGCGVTQDDTRSARFTHRSPSSAAAAVLGQASVAKRLAVLATVAVGAVQRFPIHRLAPRAAHEEAL